MAYGGLQGLGLPQASTAPGGLQLGLGLGTSQSTASTASSGLQLGQGLNASQLKTSTAPSGLQLGQPLKSQPGLALQGKAQTTESGLAALKPSRKYTFRQLEDQINKVQLSQVPTAHPSNLHPSTPHGHHSPLNPSPLTPHHSL